MRKREGVSARKTLELTIDFISVILGNKISLHFETSNWCSSSISSSSSSKSSTFIHCCFNGFLSSAVGSLQETSFFLLLILLFSISKFYFVSFNFHSICISCDVHSSFKVIKMIFYIYNYSLIIDVFLKKLIARWDTSIYPNESIDDLEITCLVW